MNPRTNHKARGCFRGWYPSPTCWESPERYQKSSKIYWPSMELTDLQKVLSFFYSELFTCNLGFTVFTVQFLAKRGKTEWWPPCFSDSETRWYEFPWLSVCFRRHHLAQILVTTVRRSKQNGCPEGPAPSSKRSWVAIPGSTAALASGGPTFFGL
jgi:hypothetical protein